MSCWPNWRLVLCCHPTISVPPSNPPPSDITPERMRTALPPQPPSLSHPQQSEQGIELEDYRPMARFATIAAPRGIHASQQSLRDAARAARRHSHDATPGAQAPTLPALSFGPSPSQNTRSAVVADEGQVSVPPDPPRNPARLLGRNTTADSETPAPPSPPRNPARLLGRNRVEHEEGSGGHSGEEVARRVEYAEGGVGRTAPRLRMRAKERGSG